MTACLNKSHKSTLMKVVVTGGAGFLGHWICRFLLQKKYQVTAIYRTERKRILKELKSKGAELFRADIIERPDDLSSPLKGADALIHCASHISIEGDKGGLVTQTNVEGASHIGKLCLSMGVKKIIYVGSIHAIDFDRNSPLVDESLPLAVNHSFAYNRSKACAQQALMSLEGGGIEVVSINPTGIIGPSDDKPSLMGKVILNLARNKLPFVTKEGFHWVDVRDAATAAVNALTKGRASQHYIITGEYCGVKEISKMVGEALGRPTVQKTVPLWLSLIGLPFIQAYSKVSHTPPLYTWESIRTIQEGNKNIVSTLAKKELDFKPRPIKDTIQDTCAWYKENGLM